MPEQIDDVNGLFDFTQQYLENPGAIWAEEMLRLAEKHTGIDLRKKLGLGSHKYRATEKSAHKSSCSLLGYSPQAFYQQSKL